MYLLYIYAILIPNWGKYLYTSKLDQIIASSNNIIFEKLNSIFSGKAKVTGTVLDYLDGDYNVSLLEAMEFITLKLDPRTTHTITDYLGADWQEADVID
ncbi:hypothetical protein N3Z16_08695 [Candidatus Megaera polyxenophila]|uniref:hypothetical protein n=1 Tax=Candidatus Megaera polyxenophila TaxID=988779 RepID=UPI00249DFA3F|nr:hypothetical protein N3Z16_08695 [Candidatus Megaera polyxenophila]